MGEKYFLTCCREICNGDFRNDDYDYFAINGQSANSSNADAASGMSCSRAKRGATFESKQLTELWMTKDSKQYLHHVVAMFVSIHSIIL